jgi:hypothetical protein
MVLVASRVENPACTIKMSDTDPVGDCIGTQAPPVVIVEATGRDPGAEVAIGVEMSVQEYH